MSLLRVLFLSLFFVGCGSPLNHKVSVDERMSQANEEGVDSFLSLSNTGLSVETQWLEGPFDNSFKESKLMIFIRDENDHLTSLNSEIGFYAWMPSMGHPMEDAGFFEEVSKGVYLNSHIKFNMGGEWEMFIQVYGEDYSLESEALWKEFL